MNKSNKHIIAEHFQKEADYKEKVKPLFDELIKAYREFITDFGKKPNVLYMGYMCLERFKKACGVILPYNDESRDKTWQQYYYRGIVIEKTIGFCDTFKFNYKETETK